MMKKLLSGLLAGMMLMATTLVGCNTDSTNSSENSATGDAGKGSGSVIKIICPYGVGGTADAIARRYALVAGRLYPDYQFIVENKTGGDGFAAATYYAELDPSTTELLIFGHGVAYRHDIGKKYNTEEVPFDVEQIRPVASIDDRTWILYTKKGVTFEEILEKAKTSGIKMSGGNPLSDPHLALGSLMARENGKVMVVPYDGGANQKKGLVDGEVDVFVGTTQAAQEDVEAGILDPVLAFSDKTFDGFVSPAGAISVPGIAGTGVHPALTASVDHMGSILPAGGFIASRTGADQAWIDQVVEISKAVWNDPEYSDWISEILLNRFEVYDQDAVEFSKTAREKAMTAFETLK